MPEEHLLKLLERMALPSEVAGRVRALYARAAAAATLIDGGPPPPASGSAAGPVLRPGRPERYEDLGQIGVGGMGEVRRVRDRSLRVVLAMKVLSAEAGSRPEWAARFLEEAQVTAQLAHPGIVPVHEVGRLADGRLYYAMKEVLGRPLDAFIAEVHAASAGDVWETAPSGWSFLRLVDAFARVCEAIGYAHGRGVIHRDLKPANVVVGAHGEVQVVDWGLAKVLGRGAGAEPVRSIRSESAAHATRAGAVTGTPAYMAPEQARGDVERLDARTDVYGLGAILYEILSGRPPYVGATPAAVLVQVILGALAPPGRVVDALAGTVRFGLDEAASGVAPASPSGPPLPEELVAACLRALSPDPGARFRDGAALGAVVSGWLEGARQRARGQALVVEAAARAAEPERLHGEAAALRARAAEALSGAPRWAPEDAKAAAWSEEDRAEALEHEAEAARLEREIQLHAALGHAPELVEAHEALTLSYLEAHGRAESAGVDLEASRLEALVREHAGQLPAASVARGRALAYLEGTGGVTLVTDPPGARVRLFRYVERERRLVAEEVQADLGRTPLREASLAMGSWLLELRAEGRQAVRYPVAIGRGEHWHGVPPGEGAARPVLLPHAGDLGPDDRYVPAGWAAVGGDPEAPMSLPAGCVWVDAFVMRRFAVTHRGYLDFLNDLVAGGREAEALRLAPRGRAGTVHEQGPLLYVRESQGRFALATEGEDAWQPDWPVTFVDWGCARAFAAWEAERTGQGWRLPWELEWEKAARGADRRAFPWGQSLDPSFCCMRDSHRGPMRPVPIDSFAVDESVYGVRGLGGNVSDWCLDVYRRDGPENSDGRWVMQEEAHQSDFARVNRGGFWDGLAPSARCARRLGAPPSYRVRNLGVRLARSYP